MTVFRMVRNQNNRTSNVSSYSHAIWGLRLQICNQVFQASPLLLSTWQDLAGRKNEAVAASIPELEGQAVFGFCNISNVVGARAARGVQGATTRPCRPCCSANSADRIASCRRQGVDLGLVCCLGITVVSVRRENILSVRMPVDVQLDSIATTQLRDQRNESLVFRTVTSNLATVSFIAGIG